MRLIKDLGLMYPKETSKRKRAYGLYECPICLSDVKVIKESVDLGRSTKCKSCSGKVNSLKHGLCGHRIHAIWNNMRNRCSNKNVPAYKDYGGRGITVCAKWENDLEEFHRWASQNGYDPKLTIDRIDNNKGYSPDNCRWATMKDQARNTRRNHYITYNGITLCLAEWAIKIGMKANTLRNRLKTWSVERAIETPVNRGGI